MSDSAASDIFPSDKKLPPGPGGLGLALLRHRLRDGLGFSEHLCREYGDIVYYRMLNSNYCLVSSPEIIEEVLVSKSSSFGKGPFYKRTEIVKNPTSLTSDGEEHRRIRKLLRPSFGSKALNGYSEIMIGEALRMQETWRDGATIDIASEVNQMALTIVAKTFFGTDERIEVKTIQNILIAMAWGMKLTVLPLGGLIGRLPFLPQNRQRQRAVRDMNEVVYRVIDKTRNEAGERSDLISFLVNATDEDGFDGPLTDEEVRDESFILILAGHETTASTIAWCFYYLSRNPQAREQLEKEVDEVLDGKAPTPEDYRDFIYTRAVFDETLRLTPPIFSAGRTALEDCQIGGYHIPKGTTVQTFWRWAQRNEKYFPESEKFKPERWMGTQPSYRPRHAYVPFGGGARNCVGSGFGKMEAVFTLAAICRKWRLEVVSDEFPEVTTLALYRLKHGLPVKLIAR